MDAYTLAMDWKIQSKVIDSVNSIRIKIPPVIFGIEKLDLKFIGESKDLRRTKTILKNRNRIRKLSLLVIGTVIKIK